ncbi:uncharacterized protein FIESC28_04738 [Fusarium coffeatum]|uniref:Heterokaryon incompatibility domain-containing protein n=1 Tax=Fusarium coffeatum TaxID=231269 RepID=A0A366RZW3_9HYPO|nr:uncharacterized protein FIESC28_04738 [Fusarium coffeatum]RBR21895.1 hypothetical protein FIESC28_04738 [Fusarium coffeatum]
MASRLCDVCIKLNIEDLVSDRGFALHTNILQLHASASSCRLCNQAIERICSGHSRLNHSKENETYLASQQARVFYNHHVHSEQGFTIVVSDVSSPTPTQGQRYSWLLMRILDGDPARVLGAETVRVVPESTSSDESTVQALKWLKECLLSQDRFEHCSHTVDHSLARGLASTTLPLSNSMPEVQRLSEDIKLLYEMRVPEQVPDQDRAGRLVEIIDTEDVRLVEGSAQCTPYVALSYRWGGLEAIWQTTTKNLNSRRDVFSIEDLPKTLCDAVKVTRDLGFEWIWIDSLCIVQDDKDDWAKEAVKMANIYQNAIVTISADFSKDAKAGLHNDRSTSMFNREESIGISNRLSAGDESTLYLFPNQDTRLDESITNIRDMGDLLCHCTLRDRGWTMQERILSPRIIHYASDQLYWECYHSIQESEDKLLWMGRSSTIPKIAHRIKSAKDDGTKKKELKQMLYNWYVHIVGGDYSYRSLTYAEDKLLAIGGVARALDDIEPMGYMVGHWGEYDDELVKSFCWKRGGPGQKATKYRAPSWSWASQDSAINYTSYSLVGTSDDVVVAEPVAWKASVPDGTFFGRCTSGYLQIKAKLARGTVFPNCGYDFSNNTRSFLSGSYTVAPPKERCAFLMLEGGETSDLVWLDESQATQEPVREGIDVKVVMLSEVRPRGEEPYPGGCMICTLDKNYHLTRIGFTESVRPWKEGEGRAKPPITAPKLCDKEDIELIII